MESKLRPTFLFSFHIGTTQPYKEPLGVSAPDRWSVSSEQRWQFPLIHSLQAKLGSQSQILEWTLVTWAET